MIRTKQIIALGGGGFTVEPENPLLDDYLTEQARALGRAAPRICFVPTASGDAAGYVEAFHDAFAQRGAELSHLSLFARGPGDLRAAVLAQDLIYVGGGNSANMLAVWRMHGLDEVLREAWRAGVILAGISAGSVCWFESCLTDSFGDLRPFDGCLGLLPGSNCPHYHSEAGRRPLYHRAVADGSLPPGYAADDGVALRFVGTELAEAVTSRPDARAYRLSSKNGEAVEAILEPRYLGG